MAFDEKYWFDPDLVYDENCYKAAEDQIKKKITNLYYDCTDALDYDYIRYSKIIKKLDEFFINNIGKSL